MAFIMRTPWTIEDDLAGILWQKARTLDLPFKVVVNSALRNYSNPINPETTGGIAEANVGGGDFLNAGREDGTEMDSIKRPEVL